jgi:hypothetical protein
MLIELKREVQAGEPHGVIGKTAESYCWAIADYRYDPSEDAVHRLEAE